MICAPGLSCLMLSFLLTCRPRPSSAQKRRSGGKRRAAAAAAAAVVAAVAAAAGAGGAAAADAGAGGATERLPRAPELLLRVVLPPVGSLLPFCPAPHLCRT